MLLRYNQVEKVENVITMLTNILKSSNKMTIILKRSPFLQQWVGMTEEGGVAPINQRPL